ncbi:MAG: hypothetical protein KAR06_03720 [Deltaproteobacteria bacterium]|nr:hypothetical protein [Deltaproteobacteria bacterium]
MNNEVSQVRDIPAEFWVRVLSLFAMITIPLISTIGYLNYDRQNLIIESQKAGNATMEKFIEKVGVKFESQNNEISQIKSDVREIRGVQTNYGIRLNKLEGKR